MSEGKYRILRSDIVYRGRSLTLREETFVGYNGETSNRPVVTRKDGANIVPVTAEGNVVLIKERRFNLGAILGLPGGGIDTGETPAQTAERELMEETGYAAASFEHLFIDKGSSTIKHNRHVYLGRDAHRLNDPRPTEDESILGVVEIGLEDAIKQAMSDEFPSWIFKALIMAQNKLSGK